MKKRQPIYAITGFLGAGKTTLLNNMLSDKLKSNDAPSVLILQFENGHVALNSNSQIETHSFDIHAYATPDDLAKVLLPIIKSTKADEIYIEYNGMKESSFLEELLLNTKLSNYCYLEKVIYLATPEFILNMLDFVGPICLNQLLSADQIVLDNAYASKKDYKAAKKKIKRLAPNIQLNEESSKLSTLVSDILPILAIFFIVNLFIYERFNVLPPQLVKIISIITGICLEAFPFLILGAFLSALVQNYVSITTIEKLLKGNPVKSALVAMSSGLFMPTCDCATIPIFRSLLLKRVSLPIALIFLLSAPIMNPFVLLATYYAFGASLNMVLIRVALSLLIAVIVGLSFAKTKPSNILGGNSLLNISSIDTSYNHSKKESKWQKVLLHTENEFLLMAKYIIFGSCISAIFQVLLWPTLALNPLWQTPFVGILIAMVFAFILSLCATADAMVASSLLSIVTLPGSLAFMLLGPFFDLKNCILLSKFFTKKFVIRLGFSLIIAIISILYILLSFTNILEVII